MYTSGMRKRKQPDKIIAKIHATRGLRVEIARACGIQRAGGAALERVPVEQVHAVAELTGLTLAETPPDIIAPRKRRRPA